MERHELGARLMEPFLGELEEHVRALNRDALALEKRPPPEERADLVKALFRTVHTLKGASRIVGISAVETACHRLEAFLAAARDGRIEPGPEHIQTLFEAADALEEAGKRLRTGEPAEGGMLDALLPRLENLARQAAAPTREFASQEPALAPPAPAAPAPVSPPMAGSAPGPSPAEPVPATQEPARPEPPEEVPAEPPSSARSPARQPLPARSPEGPPTSAPQPAASKAAPAASPAVTASLPESRIGQRLSRRVEEAPYVKVRAERLDTLLALSGELLVARTRAATAQDDLEAIRDFVRRWAAEWRTTGNRSHPERSPDRNRPAPADVRDRLRQLDADLDRLASRLRADREALDQAAGPIEAMARQIRMLPFASACEGLERLVRDLARAGGKEVDLAIEGAEVELDRAVLEGIRDPLVHLVRNAVDHGIETVHRRQEAGKAPRGRVTVAARLAGPGVEVSVADDGRGFDLDAIRDAAIARGLKPPEDVDELVRLVLLPGFTTASQVSEVSGRGIGLDVVKTGVEALHGTLDFSWGAGTGTRFVLGLPLTLTTVRALLVSCAGWVFAFVATQVRSLHRARPEDLASIEGREMLVIGRTPVPVVSLGAVLGLAGPGPARPVGKAPIVVVASGDRQVAFVVDELMADQDVVIKSLDRRLARLPHIAGATMLPDGRLALILNGANLVRSALGLGPAAPVASVLAPGPAARRKRLLVVDDSVTTRSLLKTILEAADFEVTAAADGMEAWQRLQEQDVDLVVSDVAMPRMDGFQLTEAIRQNTRFEHLPVVLVTALESDEDKARGIAVGADAYLLKSAFDQTRLLQVIGQLL